MACNQPWPAICAPQQPRGQMELHARQSPQQLQFLGPMSYLQTQQPGKQGYDRKHHNYL